MANSNSNKKLVPEAMDSLDRFKYEVASDMAVKNIFENIKNEAIAWYKYIEYYIILKTYRFF